MSAEPLDTHRQAAAKLYDQRARLLEQAWVDAGSVARLEARLRAHIATTAELLEAQGFGEPPQRPGDAFVHWAAALLADPDGQLPGLLEAVAAEDEGGRAAAEAWRLLPAGDERVLEIEAARRSDAAWAAFLAGRIGTGRIAPDAVLNRALNAETEALRQRAVRAASDDPERTASFFRPWYVPGLAVSHAVAAEAVLAGLVRGDDEARRVLGSLLEAADDAAASYRAVRLMALAGAPEHRQSITLYARREPVGGARLLAIDGAPDHLETLVELLERPESAEGAAVAWWCMTGEVLPRVERMRATDAGTDSGRGEIPDAEWADGWRRRHGERLRAHPRVLFGRPLDRRSIAAAARRWAGTARDDLLAQARLIAGPALAIDGAQWITRRERALAGAGLRDQPEVPPEAATADPWAHGHYA